VKIFLDGNTELLDGQEIMQARRELRGAYQGRESVPRPKGDEEAEITEEKDASILVDGIEYRDRLGLLVVRVDLWCRPKLLELEAHGECPGKVTVGKQGLIRRGALRVGCQREKALA
jgi:hypothetical protein